jgi:plasmid stabilization system protein ParE
MECTWINERLRGLRRTLVRAPFQVYQVFYRVTDEEIEVLRVLHGSRDIHAVRLAEPIE